MADYSYNELMQMQEQAIRRVRDMQQRARKTAEESGDFLEPDTPIYNDRDNNRAEHAIEASAKSPVHLVPAKKNPGLANLTSILDKMSLDNDTALILPLILLLAKEGADEKLLLALLYIMS